MNRNKEEELWSHHLHVPLSLARRVTRKDSEEAVQVNDVFVYYCDWYPKLFGIDEDEIPSSEDEEGQFDLNAEEETENLEEKAKALTSEQLNMMRVGFWNCMTDDELREAWLREQKPRYGRRARTKPILRNKDGEDFECICDIDYHYFRHYRPKFGGGMAKEGEELLVPHFKSFWEDVKEKHDLGDLDQVPLILEPEIDQSKKQATIRPLPKFPRTSFKKVIEFRKQLLSAFRPLKCKEIRRYRMPYVEALYLELQEEDCVNGAAFFKFLIVKDYFLQKASGSSKEFCIRKNKQTITKIFEILKLAEKFYKRKEYHKEAYVYLKTGLYFIREPQWWWLTEVFYEKAVKASENCVIDGGKAEAISNYIFGTFLLDYLHRVEPAQEHLLKARSLSQGKDWSARTLVRRLEESVHKESATYLCRALTATSRELRKRGKPEEGLPLIHRAYKLCEELASWNSDIAREMYFELGMTYQEVGFLDWAKVALLKFIDLAEMENYEKGICDGYLELAITCRRQGNLALCGRYLSSFCNVAKMNKNVNLIAFGYRYLGEFHLNNGNSREAMKLFMKAFTSFLQQYDDCAKIPYSEWQSEHFTLSNDVELTRVLTGLAKGEIMAKSVCSTLLKAGTRQEKLLQLIEWKNNPDMFSLEQLEEDWGSPLKFSEVISEYPEELDSDKVSVEPEVSSIRSPTDALERDEF